ncbi:MAG: DUF397 domain-containing protein [Actinomycetota bacterium]
MSRPPSGHSCWAYAWPEFRKPTASVGAGACVEIRVDSVTILIRDSKQNHQAQQPVIEVSLDAWFQILDEFAGRLPLNVNGELRIDKAEDGSATFTSVATGVCLSYTKAEILAFEHGVLNGEFTTELVAV